MVLLFRRNSSQVYYIFRIEYRPSNSQNAGDQCGDDSQREERKWGEEKIDY